MKQYDIAIVGAGPAGLSAAVAASDEKVRILLLDQADKIGKKILVTGNGRCNLTNEKQEKSCYRSDDPEKAQAILQKFDPKATYDFFTRLGIVTRSKNGYIYPYNEQASSVREAFETFLRKKDNVDIKTNSYVKEIEPVKKGYLIHTDSEKYIASSIVITTGGFAGSKSLCDGSGYKMAGRLGHEMIKTYPALTPLKSGAPFLKKVSGVRNQAMITLLADEEVLSREQGELQWTDYGISGVAIFQLSRYAILAMEEGKNVKLLLDLLPDYKEEETEGLMEALAKACPLYTLEEILGAILPHKLVPIVLREARVKETTILSQMDEKGLSMLCHALKHFELRINGYVGYEKAQVTRGGVSLQYINDSMESLLHEGLFFAGEILDVDGTCGGYNLQWAFSSGNIAGRSAASKAVKNKRRK